MRDKKKTARGFTLMELLISILVFSLVLTGVAVAISKAGEVSAYSYTDISTRSSQNKLFNDLNISVHSLLSSKDHDYDAVTTGGVIVEDIQSDEEVEINGKTYRKVIANKVTLYTKGDVQKRILEFKEDLVQERAPIQRTGTLYDGSFRFTYDAAGTIIGESLKEETVTPCIIYTSTGEVDCSSGLEVLLDGEMLYQISLNLVLPKHKYQTKQTSITQACQQEVKVICVP